MIVSLKEKGLQVPGEEVTSGKQNGALFPYHGLPVSPRQQIKEVWDLGAEGTRDFLSSLLRNLGQGGF